LTYKNYHIIEMSFIVELLSQLFIEAVTQSILNFEQKLQQIR